MNTAPNEIPVIAVVGNPNTGKSTLFNAVSYTHLTLPTIYSV